MKDTEENYSKLLEILENSIDKLATKGPVDIGLTVKELTKDIKNLENK